nr:UV DNA damage repair endonuclease UvsE [Bacillus suaedae]
MIAVRLGYVAMSVMLSNASPSQTMTVKQFEQISNREAAIRKLERIARSNIENCLRLLKHNKAHDITFFRLSSKLVPLADHPLTEGWRYEKALADSLKELGEFIRQEKMRVDFHPDHFVVLNSSSMDVHKQSTKSLIPHLKWLKGMGIDPMHRCVLHIGGKKQGKESGLEQFIENFGLIPSSLQKMVMIENDDVSYTVEDALYLGEKLNVPVVFDLHHYDVNHESLELLALWNRVVQTWNQSPLPVKMHISSPKEGENDRRHHDFIDAERFYRFLTLIDGSVPHLDVMIEAKQKDAALLQLMKDLMSFKGIDVTSQASFTFSS